MIDVGLVGPGFWLHNEYMPDQVLHPVFGGGDSGSPAFVWKNDAHSKVAIRGFAVAGDTSTMFGPCQYGDPNIERFCYQRGFYVNWSTVQDTQNVTIVKFTG